ncbi:Glycosyl transferase family 2 [Popillia japonica]|uniref:Glycosyl transferase family 2 n=1 Tax=Popillia japonica TaxID=7064 RepID=A0AAW1IAS7_POPJA
MQLHIWRKERCEISEKVEERRREKRNRKSWTTDLIRTHNGAAFPFGFSSLSHIAMEVRTLTLYRFLGAEKKVSFDNSMDGSVAEDCYFAMRALDEGYNFTFIEGEMWEKSPFTLWDFVQQRKRWLQGILLVVHSKTIPFRKKLLLAISCYSWVTLPLSTSNIILAGLCPIPCYPIIDFLCAFIGAVNIYILPLILLCTSTFGYPENIQQFNLKWTNYATNLLEALLDKFSRGVLTDVTLCCEGTLIRAHKMILAASSTFFELFATYTESNSLIILNGVPLNDLKHLMQFMYRGEIQVQENDLLGILKLSNELQVKGLSDAKLNSVVSKSFDATVKEEQSSINEQPTSQSECSTSVNDGKKKLEKQSWQNDSSSENAKGSSLLPVLPVRAALPPKAFMMYAKIMRNNLTILYPNESSKEISIRIGGLWQNLSHDEKIKFYEIAKRKEGEPEVTQTERPLHSNVDTSTSLKRKRDGSNAKEILDPNTTVDTNTVDLDDDIELIEDNKVYNTKHPVFHERDKHAQEH